MLTCAKLLNKLRGSVAKISGFPAELLYWQYYQYLSIYLSIYEIYIAPLQGNFSEALPGKNKNFKECIIY